MSKKKPGFGVPKAGPKPSRMMDSFPRMQTGNRAQPGRRGGWKTHVHKNFLGGRTYWHSGPIAPYSRDLRWHENEWVGNTRKNEVIYRRVDSGALGDTTNKNKKVLFAFSNGDSGVRSHHIRGTSNPKEAETIARQYAQSDANKKKYGKAWKRGNELARQRRKKKGE